MQSDIRDRLRNAGIDPSALIGSDVLDDLFRKRMHQQGVRGLFPLEGEEQLQENLLATPYSSNVQQVMYDPIHDALYVTFDNRRERIGPRLYLYFQLLDHGFDTQQIFMELTTSPSPGSVVWDRLRRSGAPFQRL